MMAIITDDMINDIITRKDVLPLSFLKKSAYTGSKRQFNYKLEKTEVELPQEADTAENITADGEKKESPKKTVLRVYWWQGLMSYDAMPAEDIMSYDTEFSDAGIDDAIAYLNKKLEEQQMVLGLIGGVGSGKSTVTQVLHDEYGFELLLTDDIAKELELPGGSCYEAIIKAFGEDILEDGYGSRIANPKLASKIYADPKALETINNIVHPAVWRYVSDYIDKALSGEHNKTIAAAKGYEAAGQEQGNESPRKVGQEDIFRSRQGGEKNVRIAVETALPNEFFRTLCDEVWFIYTEREIRTKRLMSDRGYTRAKSESIIAGQLSDAEFKAAADIIIDNSGERALAEAAVRERLQQIL